MAKKTSKQIRALVLQFAGAADSGFISPGKNIKTVINPTLGSLADFDAFVVRLANAMQEGGVTFLAVPAELKECQSWNDLVTQIQLNQP